MYVHVHVQVYVQIHYHNRHLESSEGKTKLTESDIAMAKRLTESDIAYLAKKRRLAGDKIVAQPKTMPPWMRDELQRKKNEDSRKLRDEFIKHMQEKAGEEEKEAVPKVIIKADNGQPVAFRHAPYRFLRLEL